MKDDELFKLCKEVYEKTGWADTLQFFDTYLDGSYEVETVGGWESEGASYAFDSRHNIPLYTSDYLLEKLPKESKKLGYLDLCSDGDNWMARYTRLSATNTYNKADTPLKSLLKLSLALREAGELG